MKKRENGKERTSGSPVEPLFKQVLGLIVLGPYFHRGYVTDCSGPQTFICIRHNLLGSRGRALCPLSLGLSVWVQFRCGVAGAELRFLLLLGSLWKNLNLEKDVLELRQRDRHWRQLRASQHPQGLKLKDQIIDTGLEIECSVQSLHKYLGARLSYALDAAP